jgi:glutamine amidotransferase-like uncharacterized protein
MFHIGLYQHQNGSKNGSLRHVLRTLFRDTGIEIMPTDHQNFSQRDPRTILGDVFPGSLAGTTYRQELASNGHIDFLKNSMDTHGSTTLTICAMTYNVCENFHYTNPFTAEHKHIQSEIGLVPHEARGPDLRIYTPRVREENNPWSVYNATKINFKTYDGQETSGYFAISQAPSLYPNNTAKHTVIGQYADTQDVAMMEQPFGRGRLIMSGPAIEIGGYNLQNYKHSPQAQLYLEEGHDIIQKLESSKHAWGELWFRIGAAFVKDDPHYMKKIRQNVSIMCEKYYPVTPIMPIDTSLQTRIAEPTLH